MLKLLSVFLLGFMAVLCTGCFELIEETQLNKDGTGSYKLSLNLSSSTVKVNSLMAMDSIKGKKVPSKAEIQSMIKDYALNLESMKGISNVETQFNASNWIFDLRLDFEDLNRLKDGLLSLSEEISEKPIDQKVNATILDYSNQIYERKIGSLISQNWLEKAKQNENYEKLKEGNCVSIQRFEEKIKHVDSDHVKISKNGKAAMLSFSPFVFLNHPDRFDYKIVTHSE